MKPRHKILGIIYFVTFIIAGMYVDIGARFNFIMKGRYAGYATREMLNASIGKVELLCKVSFMVSIFLFVCLWRRGGKQ